LQRAQDQLTSKSTPHYKPYNVGEQVWLEGTNLKRIEGTPKLSPRWYGPFRVATKISYVAYQWDLPEIWQIHNVFHASLLTPYHEIPEHGPNFLQPPPDIIDEEPEWEVKKILKEHTFGRWRKKQYLMRCKGYSPVHDSWVSREDMHAEELIVDFEQEGPAISMTMTCGATDITTFCVPSPSSLMTSEEPTSMSNTTPDSTDTDSFHTAQSSPAMSNIDELMDNFEYSSADPAPSDYLEIYTPLGAESPRGRVPYLHSL
jgi:hypothetical protein